MPDKGWHRTFDDPIRLPDGGELRTLRGAGNYIAKLPKREHDAPAWRAAIEVPVFRHGIRTPFSGVIGIQLDPMPIDSGLTSRRGRSYALSGASHDHGGAGSGTSHSA
jgi:hypothetical protein